MRYLFGPVPSRRYGRSLGVDLSVPKTCTLDCRFCQLGPTPRTTVTRSDTPPIGEILAELRAWLAEGHTADFITASGSGEPTLHLHFGDLFRLVRAETPCRSLLLTNGSLLSLPEVRRDAALADVVKLSLHTWDQASFEHAVRPHPSLRFDTLLDGYRAFRQMYAGRLDLEVFVIPGFNDTPEAMLRIADLARSFSPDGVSLNAAVRPPADPSVAACPSTLLDRLSALFDHARPPTPPLPASADDLSDEALAALIRRHPLPLADLAATTGLPEPTLLARLERLEHASSLRLYTVGGVRFVAGLTPPHV